ncbi:DUF6461 domain-containing protein [Actinoplanes sp. NPDC051346]|uniref:DUF6461 domain-containing protein n=1 Tax=Actinoplanes sp. NPDC051346 TaxID=3155048 RepID=UPI00343047CD
MTGLAEKYAWFADYESNTYCLTIVRNCSQSEVLRRLGADGVREMSDMVAVWQETQEVEDPTSVVAVAAVGNHVLLFEPHGWRGATREVAEGISKGTVLVSHVSTINGDTRFIWAEDGVVQAEFELQSHWDIAGARAGQMGSMLVEAGFLDRESGLTDDSDVYLPAAMALAEMITEVRISLEILDNSQYLCATF